MEPQPIKLRAKYVRGGMAKKNPSKAGGNSGVNKHRGETNKDRLAAAQATTRANQMVLVLDGGRKRRWVRAADM